MHRVIKATVGNKFYQCVEAASVAFWKCSRPTFLGSMRCVPIACMKLRLPVG